MLAHAKQGFALKANRDVRRARSPHHDGARIWCMGRGSPAALPRKHGRKVPVPFPQSHHGSFQSNA